MRDPMVASKLATEPRCRHRTTSKLHSDVLVSDARRFATEHLHFKVSAIVFREFVYSPSETGKKLRRSDLPFESVTCCADRKTPSIQTAYAG
jgi:hypothetical protein